jgi:hypothetical protein
MSKTFFDNDDTDSKTGFSLTVLRAEIASLWNEVDSAKVMAIVAIAISGVAVVLAMVAIIMVKLRT